MNRTWTGSMPHNSVYQSSSSVTGHKVLIYQIAPTNNESIGEEIYDQFKQKYSPEHDDIQKVCNTSLVCLCDYFGKVDSFFYQNEMKDIFVTNGVAHLYFPLKYLLHVAPAINANMTYRKLKPQIHNYRRISDFKYIDENLDVIDKKNLIPESYYPAIKLFSQTEIIFDENDIVSSPFPVKVQSKKSEEIKLWNFKFTIFGCCMLFIFLGICYGIYRLHIRNSSSEITNV
uniref:Uncharacterized protein n=1 Tax=Panagrolaimus davidi TaxID=227884 RepID=A0A914Q8J1_9BILA